jgi:hypothetical protein
MIKNILGRELEMAKIVRVLGAPSSQFWQKIGCVEASK